MLQRYKKIAHLQVFYLLNVRLFYLDAIRGLFQCPPIGAATFHNYEL